MIVRAGMNFRETERILQVIREVTASGRRAAIATVVRVRGSAYRREGARIVIREDGTYECLLSGGCLEPAVADAAAHVIATGEPKVVRYDLEEDSVWGLGIGCSGEVDVRVERVSDDDVTRAWLRVLEQGEAAVLVTPLAGAEGRLLVWPDGRTTGDLGGTTARGPAIAQALSLARDPRGQSRAERFGAVELFFEKSEPPPRLVVFGAGADAVPLAVHARTLGFVVTVVDSREAFLTPDRFPGATLVRSDFTRLSDHLTLDSGSFVVVMNHHLERDRQSLRVALTSDAPYVGMLGPRARFQKLLAALADEGYVPTAAALERVRSPVGLALGAETPEEIALSILGEILAVRRGFEAGFLTGREASLHCPDSTILRARS
jgi:xanthine dehydrogenase accessory factor